MSLPSFFSAFIVRESKDEFIGAVEKLTLSDLPEGDLTIAVEYSAINYKDALSASGNRGVTPKYPHIPGIDAAGMIVESSSSDHPVGSRVIVTGYNLGMSHFGGFSQYIRVPSSWAIKLPESLSSKDAMTIGTAGVTAALAVEEITKHRSISDGSIAVSGASGGVGSFAVALLKIEGYEVDAISGKEEAHTLLKKLGADRIIQRSELEDLPKRPLAKPKWSGAIDCIGGRVLEQILAATNSYGAVVACGNASSGEISTTVYPFILRAIRLIGVDSQNLQMEVRQRVWSKFSGEWHPSKLGVTVDEVALDELGDHLDRIKMGGAFGRTVVKL